MTIPPLQPGLALDIDETLSITGPVWIEEFFSLQSNAPKIDAREAFRLHWYGKQTIAGYAPEDIEQFVRPKLTSNQAHASLPLIENAHHMVEKINTILPISCYLTARLETVRAGTEQWLREHGFPKRPVIMRPVDAPKGNEWKAGVLQAQHPTIRGIVDDNPRLIQFLPDSYDGTVFLYDHLDYPHDTRVNVIPCKDWESVYLEIRRMAALFGLTK